MAAATNTRSSEDRPRELIVLDYVKDRVNEISELLAVVDNDDLTAGEVTQGPRTVMQRLPRHLRRRAMSHNVKRLPRRLRNVAARFMTHSTHRKKPPSRYYRRRPHNLLKAYIRRQRKHRWLETHIWHAKRFHMVDRWGYRLADRSCQKGFRPSYRDAVNHCVIADISYYRTLELIGQQERLVEGLKRLCAPPSVGLSAACCEAMAGRQAITSMFFHPNKYPRDCIGPVQVVWNPDAADNTTTTGMRQLWLTAHCAIGDEILSAIVDVFSLNAPTTPDRSKSTHQSADEWRQSRLTFLPEWLNDDGTRLLDLQDAVARFRLIGRESSAVLAKCLKPVCDQDHVSIDTEMLNPSELLDGQVVNVATKDPRIFRSIKKAKPKRKAGVLKSSCTEAMLQKSFAIWQRSARESCLRLKLSDYKLNEMRRSMNISAPADDAVVPMLLIARNPTSSIGGRTSQSKDVGWDVVVPLGWAMPFWISLQYSTAHAIGLSDMLHLERESARFTFPDHFPDCEAGRRRAMEISAEAEKKLRGKPWNKRPPFKRLHVTHPHCFPWTSLSADWAHKKSGHRVSDSADSESVCTILRERRQLNLVRRWIKSRTVEDDRLMEALIIDQPNCLVPVVITARQRGVPKPHSMLCIPIEQDWFTDVPLETIAGSSTKQKEVVLPAPSASKELSEFVSLSNEKELDIGSLFPDSDQLTIERRKAKKKAKRKEQKKRRNNQSETAGMRVGTSSPSDSFQQRRQYDVIDSCSRLISGYVVAGGFSFSIGKGRAIGYCSLIALKEAVTDARNTTHKSLMLFRNSTSKTYWWAEFGVI